MKTNINKANPLINKLILFALFLSLTLLTACSDTISKESEQKYNKAITSLHTDTELIYSLSSITLSQYSSYWKSGIGNGNMFEKLQIAKDKNEFNIYTTNKLLESTSKNIKVLSNAAKEYPEQYEEIYTESKKLYATISAIMEQVNSPSGSYITFNENVNNLKQEFESNHKLIGLLISDEKEEVASK